ncbi:MAG: 50S ribosomal protein L13 [Desulfovibrionaceae bacterium]
MKTFAPTPIDIKREWFVVDATGMVLGRLATQVARILCGKHKAEYAHHMDMGDFVIVVNCDKLVVTGKKMGQKMYYKHTGYMGSLKEKTLAECMARYPDRVLMKAVKGMLPRNTIARAMIKKLKIYSGGEHPHGAQLPKQLSLLS